MSKGAKLSQLELTARQAVEGAKKEFGMSIDGYRIKWSIVSDDGGRILEAFVEDSEAAGVLRGKLPTKFMGFRTVVSCYNLIEDKSALRNFRYEDGD